MPQFCHGCGLAQHRVEPEAAVGDLTISLSGECWWRGRKVPLTATETMIVHALASDPGCFFRFEALANLTGSTENGGCVRTWVSKIRRLFRDVDPEFDRIETKHGFGYRWRRLEPLRVREMVPSCQPADFAR
jgi:DNA-binding response OmpR family regulator